MIFDAKGGGGEIARHANKFAALVVNSRPNILFVVHSWGGGTIRFARELVNLIAHRVNVVWAWGVENKTFHISKRGPYFAELSFDLAAGLDAPLRALNALKLSRLNIIHTIGLQEYIAILVERLAVSYDVTFTDYHHVYTKPHFEDDSGHFIGDAAVAAIQQTAGDNIPPLLRNAERRIAVSGDLARRIEGFMLGFPVIPVRISEANAAINAPVKVVRLADGEVMRVLVLGALHPVKGLATILEVSRRAQHDNFPMEIICLGEIYPDVAALLSSLPHGLRLLGPYALNDLPKIIAKLEPHLAWFPFSVPETHSYALSDAMGFGLPVLASGIGAVPERVMGRHSTWLVPFDGADAVTHFQWIKRLYRERMQTPPLWLPIDHLPRVVEKFYPDTYLEPALRPRWYPLRWLHQLMH